jgi:tRNA(Arg) A34 adenosine deaminase TadA
MTDISEFDLVILRRVLALARDSAKAGAFPFAAILCQGTNVVSRAADMRLEWRDPTAHPELIVIQEYCRREKRSLLDNCTLYSIVEPCTMCASAAYWAYVGRILFSVSQDRLQMLTGGPPCVDCAQIFARSDSEVQITGRLLESEGLAILQAHPAFSKPHSFRLSWTESGRSCR